MSWHASGMAAVTGSPWLALIPVLTVVASVVVGVYTARSARAANRETSQLSGWKSLSETHQIEIDRLRADREEDQARHRAERTEDRAAVADCRERIDALTVRVEGAERRERALILWAREVVKIMRAAKVEFPPPPAGVSDDPTTRS